MNDTFNMKRSQRYDWNPATGDLAFSIDTNELVTTDRAKMFGIKSRKCRFDTEITSNRSYPFGRYTQNLCLMKCNGDAAIKICGCRPYFYKIGGFFLFQNYHRIHTYITHSILN